MPSVNKKRGGALTRNVRALVSVGAFSAHTCYARPISEEAELLPFISDLVVSVQSFRQCLRILKEISPTLYFEITSNVATFSLILSVLAESRQSEKMSYGKDLDGALELDDFSTSASQFPRPRHDSDSDISSHTLDVSTDHAEQDALRDTTAYTVKEESAVVRKLDRHLVLFLALLYMLAFLDRSSKCQ